MEDTRDDHDIDYIRGIQEPIGTVDKGGGERGGGKRSIHTYREEQKHRYIFTLLIRRQTERCRTNLPVRSD